MPPTSDRLAQVLVIEDNPGDAQLIREVAIPLRVADWHIVADIIQARAFIERKPPYAHATRPDLVMLDLKSPVYPGHSFIATVKRDPELSTCKIAVFTSSQAARDKAICTEMGADAYIVKPVSLAAWTEALLSVLRILDKPTTPRRPTLTDVDVVLPAGSIDQPETTQT